MRKKEADVADIKKKMADISVEPGMVNGMLEEIGSASLTEKTRALKLLLRPNIGLKEITKLVPELNSLLADVDELTREQVEIQIKYDTYIEKEQEMVKKMASLEELAIPETFNYDKLTSMSTEARQKLTKIRPQTLGQASRISGVNPSDVQILMVYMGR